MTSSHSKNPLNLPKRETKLQIQLGNTSQQYHTLRYDFKPASVDSERPAEVEFMQNGEVAITAPNVAGSVASHTVFRGPRRPHVKECLLVIDNVTGEMVLQKLTDNITVKARRVTHQPAAAAAAATAASVAKGKADLMTDSAPSGHKAGKSNLNAAKLNSNMVGSNSISTNNSNSTTNNNDNNHSLNNKPISSNDGPQLSEESSSSSDSDSDSSGSSSSDDSSVSSPNEGFTF